MTIAEVIAVADRQRDCRAKVAKALFCPGTPDPLGWGATATPDLPPKELAHRQRRMCPP